MTGEPVPHIFDRETLRARLRDYNVVVFQIASSLVQSGVLALAAIVLIDILYAEREAPLLLLLWLAAFVFAVLAFERQLYLPLATPRGGVSDVWPLMLMGLAQFVSFACLSPRANGVAPWELWYFAYTAGTIMGAVTIWQAARFVTLDDYSPELRPVGESFAAWLRHDLKELVVVVSVSLVFCVILALQLLPGPAFKWLTFVVALISIFGSSWLVRRDGQRFSVLYASVYAVPGGKTPSADAGA